MDTSELFNEIMILDNQVKNNTITYSQAITTLKSFDLSIIVEVFGFKKSDMEKTIDLYISHYQDRINGVPLPPNDNPTTE